MKLIPLGKIVEDPTQPAVVEIDHPGRLALDQQVRKAHIGDRTHKEISGLKAGSVGDIIRLHVEDARLPADRIQLIQHELESIGDTDVFGGENGFKFGEERRRFEFSHGDIQGERTEPASHDTREKITMVEVFCAFC